MLHANTYQYEQMRHEQLQDCVRRGEVDSLCRNAGLDSRGFFGRAACRMIAAAGGALISTGRLLKGFEAQPAAPSTRLSSAAGPQ